jgi:hypothetical protein
VDEHIAELERAFEGVTVKFWVCPVVEHREPGPGTHQTVAWDGDVARCLTTGCGRTSAQPLVDDGRTWWALKSDLWASVWVEQAPHRRAAIAAIRREFTAAERDKGTPWRDIRELFTLGQVTVCAGPLTTPQAFDVAVAVALSAEVDRWGMDRVELVFDPANPDQVQDLIRHLTTEAGPAKTRRVCAQVLRTYLPAAERYVPCSLNAALCPGEYRELGNGRVRMCCARCAALVDADTPDRIPQHPCPPTADLP